MPVAKKRQRLSVEERRHQLLEVGLEIFSRRGLESVSIGEIADAAGVSPGLLYHYFPNKQSLYDAAVERALIDLEEVMAKANPTNSLELSDLSRMLTAYVDFAQTRAREYRFVLVRGAASSEHVRTLIDKMRSSYVDRFAVFAGDTPQFRVLGFSMIAFFETSLLAWLEQPQENRMTAEELTALTVHMAMSALQYVAHNKA